MVRCDFLGYCSELSGKNGGRLVGHHINGRKNGRNNGKKKPRKRPGPVTIWDCQIRLLNEESERHFRLPMGNDEFSYGIQKANNLKLRKELKEAVISNPFEYPRSILVRIRVWLRNFPQS